MTIQDHCTAIEVNPSASRLTDSLRDVGYNFESAIADIIDNSITAGASRVDIRLDFNGQHSWVRIVDDGSGMRPTTLNEALRFGSRRPYGARDLGRFGLGLKTASLSQCRRVTVASRVATQRRRIHVRQLDLGHVAQVDRWEIVGMPSAIAPAAAVEPLETSAGTVVLWEDLDRILGYENPEGGWARRRFDRLADDLRIHLGMVFHRFLDGDEDRAPLKITVNGKLVQSWDPFARSEEATLALPSRILEVSEGGIKGRVRYLPFVLPHRSAFSSASAFDRYSGPKKWNRQQGFYVYRAGRLIQSGGWNGIRAIDEHHKFARVAIDFDPELDGIFKVNVAKMRISVPTGLRAQLEREVSEVCREAANRYRRGELANHDGNRSRRDSNVDYRSVGVSLKAAALETGDLPALDRIARKLRQRVPIVAEGLGF